MAPYLFFLGCGTYAVFTQEFEYPDGRHAHSNCLSRRVRTRSGRIGLDMLADAVLWVPVYRPGRYTGVLTERLYLLIQGTGRIKKTDPDPEIQKTPYGLRALAEQMNPGTSIPGRSIVR